MNSRLLAVLVGIFLGVGAIAWPQTIKAEWTRLQVVYTGRNLTAGTDWEENVSANPGDIVELRAVLSNNEPGSTIRDVKIQVPLMADERVVYHPRFHLRAMNAGILDTDVAVNLPSSYITMVYLPGTAKVTSGGSTKAISPDTEKANLTTQEVAINDIPYGEGNAATVTCQVQMVAADSSNTNDSNSSSTSSGGIGGGDVAGTASTSAVAETSPKTGIGDSLWLSTGGWLVLGIGGIGLKKLAMKIWERTLV